MRCAPNGSGVSAHGLLNAGCFGENHPVGVYLIKSLEISVIIRGSLCTAALFSDQFRTNHGVTMFVTPTRTSVSRHWPFNTTNGSTATAFRFTGAVALAVLFLLSVGTPRAAADEPAAAPCPEGTFCAWQHPEYGGSSEEFSLTNTELETCVALPPGTGSFVNLIDRPVTVYADAACGSEDDFSTFPGGSHVPNVPYQAAAIQIWEH